MGPFDGNAAGATCGAGPAALSGAAGETAAGCAAPEESGAAGALCADATAGPISSAATRSAKPEGRRKVSGVWESIFIVTSLSPPFDQPCDLETCVPLAERLARVDDHRSVAVRRVEPVPAIVDSNAHIPLRGQRPREREPRTSGPFVDRSEIDHHRAASARIDRDLIRVVAQMQHPDARGG